MKLHYLAALGALVLGAAAQAEAISATSPQSIVSAMQNAGYKATLTKDNSGDPMINSSSGGSNFSVFFFGCTKNTDCRTVQFYAGYSDRKPSLSQMNDWNSKKRFSRAYISDSGNARIEMDLDLDDGGMSTKLFEDNLEFWVAVMGAFEKHIAG
ncbi:YbjN domain-containing protein [Sphingomonas sp. SUN039]|uniref:YbjN domain-containing protein n=1 Tax=Sphingomonas sp. SUN039 TaxID=2937787 RepID=UPI0021646FF9|nr:YbjN domain-containing protein [Sphingomonas sp. SUN039]UVO53160.1 YbjN domain-containing protein [Sphingomonas sp. SUN039]